MARIDRDTYVDSMSLMALSTKANELDGVEQAMIGMGTDLNKQVIESVGLMTPDIRDAGRSDLITVVDVAKGQDPGEVFAAIDELRAAGPGSNTDAATSFRSLDQALREDAYANLVVISVPGEYAAREAKRALQHDKHVMIFSDNVSLGDEIELKRTAHEKGLLVMGPDCGTAIVNGTGLCFANEVRRGRIGIVAASGTGSQEVSVQIDALGGGVSQLIGVGGRDLSEEVGGVMMLDGIDLLTADEGTDVIVVLSKPPAQPVQDAILERAVEAGKPFVACFIGSTRIDAAPQDVSIVGTSLDAARTAVQLSGTPVSDEPELDLAAYEADSVRQSWSPGQRYVRGLFCGGTVNDEVYYQLEAQLDGVHSNVAGDPATRLESGGKSREHSVIDFGSDEYTQGRPHPMIDPTLRAARLVEESADPEVAVILLDFELGYGSNPDPVGAMLEAIEKAKTTAEQAQRPLEVIGYVLGTDGDPQNKASQTARLHHAGVRTVSNVIELGALAAAYLDAERN
jgi:succinyl-CoA synthetase alpha subunit